MLRPARTAASRPVCNLCSARSLVQIAPWIRTVQVSTATNGDKGLCKTTTWRRCYATRRLDVVKLRADVDQRSRDGFYRLSKSQGSLQLEADKANAIYKDFLAHESKYDHGGHVIRLAKKYACAIEDITDIALVTYKIPDLDDAEKIRQIPASQHKPTAGLMLRGCAQAGDPSAIVHILTAVYTNSIGSDDAARRIASLFPQSEIAKYRSTLDKLCSTSEKITLGPDCLTLQGLFLEKEGQKQKAREAFELAINRSHLQPVAGTKNPLLLPLIAPWNALSYMLASDKDPTVQAQAKKYFLLGAQEADDPLSCYEVTKYEPRTSTNWLRFTSKAAASGHRQAAVNLAEFYQELGKDAKPKLESSGLRDTLDWLLGWKPDSAAALAQEWFQVASNLGHKPSMLQLANYCESVGNQEQAVDYLRRILEPPKSSSQVEEWPQVVQQAQRRLASKRMLPT
ncbi:hypothetical protein T440DRAFT_392126 [Plenodomus tracheiphilus IPT5]|uniref:HCP-like protein n=1 Tax=Plenodomus tracheiphilus IPT5 TaxID=1408161 RepID=A0A6A7BCZ2_9PLEO|nr:hypothetical protein T440DRAFT_392126 [Plenodomus tracheiphilus IPT5]